jgi:hypothetical protein
LALEAENIESKTVMETDAFATLASIRIMEALFLKAFDTGHAVRVWYPMEIENYC